MMNGLLSCLELKRLEEAFVGEGDVAAGVVGSLALAECRQEHRRIRTAIDHLLACESVGDSEEESFSDMIFKEIVDDNAVASECSGDIVGHSRSDVSCTSF